MNIPAEPEMFTPEQEWNRVQSLRALNRRVVNQLESTDRRAHVLEVMSGILVRPSRALRLEFSSGRITFPDPSGNPPQKKLPVTRNLNHVVRAYCL
jgi:hypothetical protein